MINYKNEEKNKKILLRKNNNINKDHFDNMTPTQTYIYKPHIKQSMYNYYLKSQIDNLPGKRLSRIKKVPIKKSGKRLFYNNNLEETKDNNISNIFNNQIKYNKKTNVANNAKSYSKVYEFDNPIISDREMKKKNK